MLQSFRGQSGRAYRFHRMDIDAPWATETGVALFAARGPYGWRIVRLTALSGRAHGVQPIWALADAQRYGATAVFVCRMEPGELQDAVLEDLELGLNPVVSDFRELDPLESLAA